MWNLSLRQHATTVLTETYEQTYIANLLTPVRGDDSSMDLGIAGRVALVTGAARGIGLEIASRLAEEGCRVAICDIVEPSVAILPGECAFQLCDVTDPGEVEEMLGQIEGELGAVEILVNNAGTDSRGPLDELPLKEWRRTMRVNLDSAFITSKLLVPEMKKRKWGRVVNIASMGGKVGGLTVSAAYASSKAGLIGLTKSVARYGAPEVTSNAVAPAFIATAMTDSATKELYRSQIPVQRFGTPEDVAAAVAYLASDLAGYITGEILDVNGGMLMD